MGVPERDQRDDPHRTETARLGNSEPAPDEASAIAALLEEEFGRAAPADPGDTPAVLFVLRQFIQTPLPTRRPSTETWECSNGGTRLISSGGLTQTGRRVVATFGPLQDRIVTHLVTRIKEVQRRPGADERTLNLGPTYGAFLRDAGIRGNYRGSGAAGRRMREAICGLLDAKFDIEEKGLRRPFLVVSEVRGTWFDLNDDNHPILPGRTDMIVQFSEAFWAMASASVPVRADVLDALRGSPLATKLYKWLNWRNYTLNRSGKEQLEILYTTLMGQFAPDCKWENRHKFRAHFNRALELVRRAMSEAADDESQHLDVSTDQVLGRQGARGIVLRPTEQLVPGNPEQIDPKRVAEIFRRRRFDAETLALASRSSKGWDIGYLNDKYFAFMAGKPLPRCAELSFKGFVRTHIARNPQGPV